MASKFINLTDVNRAEILAKCTSKTLRSKMNTANTRIKPRSAKNKGIFLQKWVCEQLSSLLEVPFDNQDEQCEIHSREMGLSGNDIILRGSAYKRFPYDVECKNTESFSVGAVIEQAKANTKEGRDFLIVHKSKRIGNPIVVLTWEAFAKLFRKTL